MNSVTLIFGKRGSGKTTLCKKLLEKINRKIVIDYIGEYQGTIVNDEISMLNEIRKNPKRFDIVIRLKEKRDNIFTVLNSMTNYTLIVEELSLYCNPHNIEPGLYGIIAYGRHKNISFVGISQRPAQINRLITSQATTIFTFRQVEPIDVKYLETFGFESINKLPQYQYQRKDF